eukprot:7830851-Prorocentrum_lima.AAC.1
MPKHGGKPHCTTLTLVFFPFHSQKSARRAVPVTLPGGHVARNLPEHLRWPGKSRIPLEGTQRARNHATMKMS